MCDSKTCLKKINNLNFDPKIAIYWIFSWKLLYIKIWTKFAICVLLGQSYTLDWSTVGNTAWNIKIFNGKNEKIHKPLARFWLNWPCGPHPRHPGTRGSWPAWWPAFQSCWRCWREVWQHRTCHCQSTARKPDVNFSFLIGKSIKMHFPV